MAISSEEKDTAVASKETTMDPIESKEALPWVTEVWEYLIRDTSKSVNRLFLKNRKEESYNDSTDNEGEDLIRDLPKRGEGQRKSRLNHAPLHTYMYMYLTKWKPRHLFCLLYVGLLLISGVAGHGERDNPNDPLIINTRKRTVQEGDEYVVTEWPRSDDKQVFPFNVLIGENYDCIQQSFTDDSLSICTLSLKNSTNCGLSLKSSAEKHQLVYPMVVRDFTYCIFQNAINNYTILCGTVSVVPNKTSDTGNEESPTVNPTTEATTCKPGNEESPTVNPTTEATTCKPAASRNDDCWYKNGFFVLLAVLLACLLALAFFFGWQIYKNREKSGGAATVYPRVSFNKIAKWNGNRETTNTVTGGEERGEEKKEEEPSSPAPISVEIQSTPDS